MSEYTIEKKIIPGVVQKALAGNNFIIAHESGNPNNVGPDSLDNEVNFMHRNYPSAKVFVTHWVGGGGRIVQTANVGKHQNGVGPAANGYSYAQVELARTDNAETFKKDYAAYVWLLRKLANEAKLPVTVDAGSKLSDKGIKTHLWVTNNLGRTTHTDPYGYLASWGISKAQFKNDVERGVATVTPTPTPSTNKPTLKSLDVIAQEVLAGKWGNGDERKQKLQAAGYNFEQVQTKVNTSAVNKPAAKPAPTKGLTEIAREVTAGQWGNGDDRKKRLEARGYNFNQVQAEVNRLAGVKAQPAAKSIDTLVKETLAGKHGNGDARKKSLGANYDAVMNKINGGAVAKPSLKPLNTIAKEVIAGKWGNGDQRKKNLEKAGYDFNSVQKEVNRIL